MRKRDNKRENDKKEKIEARKKTGKKWLKIKILDKREFMWRREMISWNKNNRDEGDKKPEIEVKRRKKAGKQKWKEDECGKESWWKMRVIGGVRGKVKRSEREKEKVYKKRNK